MARRRSGRRSSSGVTGFLSDIVDDVKDFVDEDVLDRTRDAERDLRRAGRNWTDSDDRGRRSRDSAGGRDRDRDGGREQEMEELRRAIRSLADKINTLSGVTTASDLPVAGYDDMTAVEISDRLTSLSQADLEKVDAYERRHANRSTVLGRIDTLRGSEPWRGYDDQTVVEIRSALADSDEATANEVRRYESSHKNRQGVLDAVEAVSRKVQPSK
jgi:hypothetical protein